MFQPLFKTVDKITGMESIVSAMEVPGGCVLRTQTVLRDNFSEATTFVPGTVASAGKLIWNEPPSTPQFNEELARNIAREELSRLFNDRATPVPMATDMATKLSYVTPETTTA